MHNLLFELFRRGAFGDGNFRNLLDYITFSSVYGVVCQMMKRTARRRRSKAACRRISISPTASIEVGGRKDGRNVQAGFERQKRLPRRSVHRAYAFQGKARASGGRRNDGNYGKALRPRRDVQLRRKYAGFAASGCMAKFKDGEMRGRSFGFSARLRSLRTM